MSNPTYFFQVSGNLKTKQRPRKGHTNSPEYRAFKSNSISVFMEQHRAYGIPTIGEQCDVSYFFFGDFHHAIDADNFCGGIQDALVKAQVLRNDCISNVIPLHVYAHRVPGTMVHCIVRIEVKPISVDDWRHLLPKEMVQDLVKTYGLED